MEEVVSAPENVLRKSEVDFSEGSRFRRLAAEREKPMRSRALFGSGRRTVGSGTKCTSCTVCALSDMNSSKALSLLDD